VIRPVWAEIDLSAVRENLRAIRARVGSCVRIMPAVKADAYGHGAVEVSRACVEAGADALCVACVEEAIELREAGVEAEILVLGCSSLEAVGPTLDYRLTSAVCDMSFATALSDAAVLRGINARVHVKVDTGMGRIGVGPDEAVDFIKGVAALPGLDLTGVFTHFASSDEADRSFTASQISLFRQAASGVASLGSSPIFHASNSAAILQWPEADFDGVRPGLTVYGLYPACGPGRGIEVREVLTLKTRVVFMKTVPSGTPISYGRTHIVRRPSRIATLPVGYADGYSRALSNRGEAAVRGVGVPVIGRVCMDQIMIDVTDVPDAQVGDEVVLYGGGFDYLGVGNIAARIGTIPYEVLCAISKRVPRIYQN